MPISFCVDHGRHFVATVASGTIAAYDLLRWLQLRQQMRGSEYPTLIDVRGYDVTLSGENAATIVGTLRAIAADVDVTLGPIALVVTNEHLFNMVSMVGILAHGVCEVRPFYDRGSAQALLVEAAASL